MWVDDVILTGSGAQYTTEYRTTAVNIQSSLFQRVLATLCLKYCAIVYDGGGLCVILASECLW
jgi:hypothetical protein